MPLYCLGTWTFEGVIQSGKVARLTRVVNADNDPCTQAGKADVLVATDVASKGLDFPDIQHVINFDMPSEIENYVHRIGRTGRCGKTGIATSFINKNQSESILLDLKHLLKEAKQRIPPVLMVRPAPALPCTVRQHKMPFLCLEVSNQS